MVCLGKRCEDHRDRERCVLHACLQRNRVTLTRQEACDPRDDVAEHHAAPRDEDAGEKAGILCGQQEVHLVGHGGDEQDGQQQRPRDGAHPLDFLCGFHRAMSNPHAACDG
jgi:hypothetical protein